MSSGRMGHWLQWQVHTGADDGAGGLDPEGWEDLRAGWGEVRPMSAMQQLVAGVLQVETSHRIRVHYDATLLEERRALRIRDLDGPLYHVRSVRDVDGRRRALEVDAVQVSEDA
jgi:SPP1 family predicted phage head-tail adaptor